MKTPSSKRGSPEPATAAIHGSDARRPFLPHRAELLILTVLVAAVVAFTHWPVLDAKAINLDDKQYLFENPVLQHPSWASAGIVLREVFRSSTVEGYYEPLTLLSLMLDVAAGGRPDNLKPFHVTSLALHLLNTALIIVFLYTLFGRPWVAAGVGLLFGVHPLTVEPVAWVWERKTVLAAFFALWCLILYVRYARRPGVSVYISALVVFVLALMAKPTVTPLPVLLLLLDFWPLQRLSRRAVLEKMPFLAIAGLAAVVTMISTTRNAVVTLPGGDSMVQLPLKVCYLIVFYLCKVVWPVNLSSIYILPEPMALSQPVVLGAVAATCVLLVLLAASWRWTRAPATGELFFLAAISPTLGVVQYSWVAASDKYAYLPAVGYLLVLVWLLDHAASRPANGRPTWRSTALGAGVLATAGLLAIGTRHYLREWQTSKRHDFYMLSLAPNSPHVHNDCGNVLADEGDYPLAIWHYTQAIDRDPWLVDAYYNRGHAFDRQGNTAQAISDYSKAISLKPGHARAYNNRGALYAGIGDHTRAVQDCTRAIELNPEYVEAYTNRGSAYKRKGDFSLALSDYTRAIELNPRLAQAYSNRGNVYTVTRDFAEAIRDYTRAIELEPDLAEVYINRGNAFNDLRDWGRAIQDYAKAIELKPGYADAYCNRANTYSDMGDFSQAIRDYSKAIELKPAYADAYHNRAVAYYRLQQYDKAWEDLQKCQQAGGRPTPEIMRALSEAAGHTK